MPSLLIKRASFTSTCFEKQQMKMNFFSHQTCLSILVFILLFASTFLFVGCKESTMLLKTSHPSNQSGFRTSSVSQPLKVTTAHDAWDQEVRNIPIISLLEPKPGSVRFSRVKPDMISSVSFGSRIKRPFEGRFERRTKRGFTSDSVSRRSPEDVCKSVSDWVTKVCVYFYF